MSFFYVWSYKKFYAYSVFEILWNMSLFMIFTCCICTYNSTIHFACNVLVIPNWRAILSHGDIPRFSWFGTSVAIHVLYFSEIRLSSFVNPLQPGIDVFRGYRKATPGSNGLTKISSGWNLFVKLCRTITTSQICFAHNSFKTLFQTHHLFSWCSLCKLVASVRNTLNCRQCKCGCNQAFELNWNNLFSSQKPKVYNQNKLILTIVYDNS